MNLEARIRRDPWTRKVGIAIFDASGEFNSVAKPLTMCDRGINEAISPAFELCDEKAQLLLDELWRAGFRPTEGIENAGQLKATENHLADMRKLTFELFELTSKA